MPNSTIPKISRRRSSSSHGGGDRTTTIVGLLFSTNLIHLLFFPCRTEIVASRREILSPIFFLFRKQEETSFFLSFRKKKRKKIPSTHLVRLIDQRTVSNLDCVSSILFRRRNENAIDTMTMCVIQIVPQFLDVSPTYRAEGGRSESWKGKDGMGGRPGNWGFQVDAPLRSLANEGSTPCAIP